MSALLIFRAMQNKTIVRNYCESTKKTEIRKTNNNKYWYDCGANRTHTLLVGIQNGLATSGSSLIIAYKIKYTLTIKLSDLIP